MKVKGVKNFVLFHKKMTYFIILALVILLLYIIYSFHISFTLNEIIMKAMNDEKYIDDFTYLISEEKYVSLNPRQPELEENLTVKTECSNSFPFILPWITDAKYTFSYKSTDRKTNEVLYDDPQSHVTLKLHYSFLQFSVSEVIVAP